MSENDHNYKLMINFHSAICEKNEKEIKEILERGNLTQEQKSYLFNSRIYGSLHPIEHAALLGHIDICKLLIIHGDDLERKQSYNYTPLFLAVKRGHKQTVKFLLEIGADINVKIGFNDDTLLHVAVNNRDLACCKLLLKNGANVNETNSYGCSPMHYSAFYGFTEISELFKKYGADMELKDSSMKNSRMYEEEFNKRNEEFQKNRSNYREVDMFGRFLPRNNSINASKPS